MKALFLTKDCCGNISDNAAYFLVSLFKRLGSILPDAMAFSNHNFKDSIDNSISSRIISFSLESVFNVESISSVTIERSFAITCGTYSRPMEANL